MASPAADHQHDLQIWIDALQGHDGLELLRIGDHDATVAGRRILEAAVGVVDVGKLGHIRESLAVLGVVSEYDRGLTDIRTVGTVVFRSSGTGPVVGTAVVSATRATATPVIGISADRRSRNHKIAFRLGA